ncbi:MAG: RNA polymerase sigma factor [Planctomycetota bacterium]
MDSDADVREAIRGDRDAFARLYERFARAVFVDLVARLRRREDAEDALQATFLAAWTNLPRLRRPGRFPAWLFRIARNKARDRLRRDRPRLVLLRPNQDLLASEAGDEAELETLRELISHLRPDTRAIVLLRTLEGWTAEEVAAAHGLSASTVRRRYAKALEHLRAGLAGRTTHDGPERHRETRRVGL